MLLITTPGRRTGVPRSACVRFLETPDGLVVWGTGSGSPRDPDWFENLRAADVADVQVRADSLPRPGRASSWGRRATSMWQDTVLAQAPEVAKYARKAGRTIPVAVLERWLDPAHDPVRVGGRGRDRTCDRSLVRRELSR